MKNNLKNIDIGKIGATSKVVERSAEKKNIREGTKAKHLPKVPVAYFDAYETLKANAGTSVTFTGYILEALREKLKRDTQREMKSWKSFVSWIYVLAVGVLVLRVRLRFPKQKLIWWIFHWMRWKSRK